MTYMWQTQLKPGRGAAENIPPVAMTESSWDILLTLFSEPDGNVSLPRLAALTSVSLEVLSDWLADLEVRKFITGTRDNPEGELRATLTPSGRALLRAYFAACGELQAGTAH